MGCDIHMVLEQKIEGAWHCIWNDIVSPRVDVKEEPDSTPWQFPLIRRRNYDFFACLAGVRGEGPDPKGVPEDVSAVAKHRIDRWGSDGHSHSWDYLDDFCAKWGEPGTDEEKLQFTKEHLEGTTKDLPNWLFGLYVGDPEDGYEGLVRDFRVVYWFDS